MHQEFDFPYFLQNLVNTVTLGKKGEEFMQSADKYKQILQDVSDSIADAIKNYQM